MSEPRAFLEHQKKESKIMKTQYVMTLAEILRICQPDPSHSKRYWRQSAIGAVFVQRTMLSHLYRGNGNRAKRRAGIDPKANTGVPWVAVTWRKVGGAR